MSDELHNLINGYLDGCLSDQEARRLNELLQADADHARRFAWAVLLHDRLQAEVQTGALSAAPLSEPPRVVPISRQRRWTATAVGAIAAIVLLGVFLWHGDTVPTASAAVLALDRMIEAASQPVDRMYRIRVTDHGPGGARPPVFSGGKGRKPGVDGAELYVRGSDKFVLVRHFGNGSDFITGSDGALGWAVAPKGPVHVSRDTRRFRRAVPGEHEEVPFLDLNAGFAELRRGYQLELSTAEETSNQKPETQHQLVAVKRSSDRPGPERVTLWFDSTGVAHRIELAGLPPDEGGARAVVLELVDQRDLGPDFFKHETHHDASRPVDWE